MSEENNGLTEEKLKFAYFLASHKILFKKIAIGLLILFNIIIYPILFYHFTLYFSQSKEIDKILEELTQRNIEFDVIRKANVPASPEVVLTQVVATNEDKFNLICRVYNPNRHWFIKSLIYKFISASGFESKEYTDFILPETEKNLVSFGEKINGRVDQISCEILQIDWQRVLADQFKFLTIPDDFSFRDIKYWPASTIDGGAISQFKFINSTIYNFWQINFLVLLYEGNQIVGVEKTKIEEVLSGAEKEMKIIWSNTSPFVSRTIIQPEVNILDQSSFMVVKLKPEEEK